MEIKQQLRLSQQLVMTPQLQQAIRLLQLSRLELIEEVRKELDNNPVLAEDEPKRGRATSRGDQPQHQRSPHSSRMPSVPPETTEQKVGEARAREVDWEKFLENRTLQQAAGRAARRLRGAAAHRAEPHQAPQSAGPPAVAAADERLYRSERRFAELVIGNLDEKGYLDLRAWSDRTAPARRT